MQSLGKINSSKEEQEKAASIEELEKTLARIHIDVVNAKIALERLKYPE